jgi:hypothetical protein
MHVIYPQVGGFLLEYFYSIRNPPTMAPIYVSYISNVSTLSYCTQKRDKYL